jgi:predicted GTPase
MAEDAHVETIPARPARVNKPGSSERLGGPQGCTPSFQRYLENQLRESFGFEGTPLRLVFRRHGEKGPGKGKVKAKPAE